MKIIDRIGDVFRYLCAQLGGVPISNNSQSIDSEDDSLENLANAEGKTVDEKYLTLPTAVEIIRALLNGQPNYMYWEPAARRAEEFLRAFGAIQREISEPPTDEQSKKSCNWCGHDIVTLDGCCLNCCHKQ